MLLFAATLSSLLPSGIVTVDANFTRLTRSLQTPTRLQDHLVVRQLLHAATHQRSHRHCLREYDAPDLLCHVMPYHADLTCVAVRMVSTQVVLSRRTEQASRRINVAQPRRLITVLDCVCDVARLGSIECRKTVEVGGGDSAGCRDTSAERGQRGWLVIGSLFVHV